MTVMKRRVFAKTAAASLVLAPAFVSTAFAADAKAGATVKTSGTKEIFTAGKQYRVLATPAPNGAPNGKVAVLEFFWYACPHCFEFEPMLETWLKNIPSYYAFERVPINFGNGFDTLQKLFYALFDMGLTDTMQYKVMVAVQRNGANLNTDDGVYGWIKTQKNIDFNKFKSIYTSFGVTTRASRATQLQNAYGLEGVPCMGIAGKYLTDPTMTQGLENVLKVSDFLAAKEHAS